jgi:hypothetical protein
LLCSGPELAELVRNALTVSAPDEPGIKLKPHIQSEWVDEERGKSLLLRVTLSVEQMCCPSEYRSHGSELRLNTCFEASSIVPHLEDITQQVVLSAEETANIVPIPSFPEQLANGSSPGPITFYLQDRLGVPSVWDRDGWTAKVCLDADDGIAVPATIEELILTEGSHCLTVDMPPVWIKGLRSSWTNVDVYLETSAPGGRKSSRLTSRSSQAREGLRSAPVSIRVNSSGRMGRVHLLKSDGTSIVDCNALGDEFCGTIQGRQGEAVQLHAWIYDDSGQMMHGTGIEAKLDGVKLEVRIPRDCCHATGSFNKLMADVEVNHYTGMWCAIDNINSLITFAGDAPRRRKVHPCRADYYTAVFPHSGDLDCLDWRPRDVEPGAAECEVGSKKARRRCKSGRLTFIAPLF